jgi:hypothetical protein
MQFEATRSRPNISARARPSRPSPGPTERLAWPARRASTGVEIGDAHEVAVYRLSEEALQAGRQEYQALLRQVAACLETNAWPSRYPDEQLLRLPAWKIRAVESDFDISEVINDSNVEA